MLKKATPRPRVGPFRGRGGAGRSAPARTSWAQGVAALGRGEVAGWRGLESERGLSSMVAGPGLLPGFHTSRRVASGSQVKSSSWTPPLRTIALVKASNGAVGLEKVGGLICSIRGRRRCKEGGVRVSASPGPGAAELSCQSVVAAGVGGPCLARPPNLHQPLIPSPGSCM